MSDTGAQGDRGEQGVDSGADRRMADVLRGSSGPAEVRRRLEGEQSEEASDVLSRLNALDFVEKVVGADVDVPERIGSYRVKGLLGRGGMGTVYLCWQEDLEREVALKVLSRGFTADPTMRKRFRAEARATAALHHRHIVPIYDYGEAQGMLFFAMERVEGMSLDKHVTASRRVGTFPMEPLEAARRFAGVADALGLAHRRRLLHRDVKPGNIMVAADGTLALTDFGLAKALDQASAHVTSQDGGFLGTLHYASPEQALGRDLTPASDLYSLGVTMFEAVSGQLPVSGASTEALLQSVLHGTRRRLRDFVPKPPRDLEAVLEKLLSREGRDRYQDGEDLARDLLRIADGEPVHIRRIPWHVRLWRRARKNPVLTGALAAVLIFAFVTIFLLGLWSREQGRGRESRHENQLVAIERSISGERGSAWGPKPMFAALTGVKVPSFEPNPSILEVLEVTRAAMPDDPRVPAMYRAYVEDPASQASRYLAQGRGFEAVQLYDVAIRAAIDERAGSDPSIDLSLYNLYLGRGVARLTAAVALPEDARTDLELASFLRPGAAFPNVVLDMLEVVRGEDVRVASARARERAQGFSAGYREALGTLLWAAAGYRPIELSNMMDFRLSHERQRAVHALATTLLQQSPQPCVLHGQPTGFAKTLATLCGRALERRADPAALRMIDAQVGNLVERAIRPGAEAAGWGHLLQLLTRPRQRGPLLDQQQQPLSPQLQLATWRCLLALDPKSAVARLWLPRFGDFQRENPGLEGLLEAAARMHLLAESKEALQWSEQWALASSRDPAARFCRMQARLRQQQLAGAQDDAIACIQSAIEPQRALRDIVDWMGRLTTTAAPPGSEGLFQMVESFRSMLGKDLPDFRGGK